MTADNVTVPPMVLESIAHNLCSLHDFDPEFVMGQERFARAVITEYLRAAPSVPSPVDQGSFAGAHTQPGAADGVAQWQPIETAPRDGTAIIGLTKRGEVYRVWWFLFEEGWDWQDDGDSEQQITHWMPLPLPPAEVKAETGR